MAMSVLLAGSMALVSGLAPSSGAEVGCSTAPAAPVAELLYRLEAGEERVTPGVREQALEIVCERLLALAVPEAQVSAVGPGLMRVLVPAGAVSRRAIEQIGGGQAYF